MRDSNCLPLPRRSKADFDPTSFCACGKKDVIRSLPCSFFPTATRCAGLAVGVPPCGRRFSETGNIDFNYPLQIMIIRTTLSRWVMCSDLSFPSLCFSITPVVSGAAAVLIRSVCPTVWVCGEEPSRLLQCIHIGRAECEDQRGHGCDAFPDLFH